MAIEPTEAIKIFFSYAHQDKKLRDELDEHLSPLRRSGLIVTWYDRAIQAGTQWEDEINTRLNTADLILLLISHHFIASEYCYGREMSRALEKYDSGEAQVIPIILRDVLWEDTPIGKLQVLPRDGKPITESRRRESAFKKVALDIREVVNTLRNRQKAAHQTMQKTQTIDTHEAIRIFHQLMKTDVERQLRVMYIIGAEKMGKSHLLKKVFPVLAQHEYQARCILLDLRPPGVGSTSDILNMIYEQLGAKNCANYYKAMQEMMNQMTLEGNIARLVADFASFNLSTHLLNDAHVREDRLTTQLVLDLSKLNDKPLVLVFDTLHLLNNDQIKLWLIKTFLTKLSLLPHVRIVIADRTLPEAPNDYIDLLQIHPLHAVQDEEEYITYCQGLHTALIEQEIRSLARECDYIPGSFVSSLSTRVRLQGT